MANKRTAVPRYLQDVITARLRVVSQSTLARRCGLTQQQISNLASGRSLRVSPRKQAQFIKGIRITYDLYLALTSDIVVILDDDT